MILFNEVRTNELHGYLDEKALAEAKERIQEVESVSYGVDGGCGYKNDIFVSIQCREEHFVDTKCICREMLNQEALKDANIDLALAQNIANYVSGLLGGLFVYHG